MGDLDPTHGPPAPGDSLPASPAPAPIPVFRKDEWIGRYQVVRLIGRGGMGMVYEAMQQQPSRKVALKVMDPSLASPGALRRFETEAQLLGRLDHPNIARIFEAGTHCEPRIDAVPVPYLAMEYISDARPITEYSLAKGLDIKGRLELMATVCDAVQHGHSEGVMHRDLKPENVLVDGQGRAKVIDFGIAKVTQPELAATRVTEVGQLVGTMQYMSPEQFDGYSDRLDARSDVYSLGVLLYEVVCGRLPYEITGKTIIQAAHVVREQDPISPGRLRPQFKGDIETVILKAMHKERERRYQTAHGLAEDLRRILRHDPIVARQDSMVYVVRRRTAVWAGRKPELMMMLLISLALVSIAAILENSSILGASLGDAWFTNRMMSGPIPRPLAGPWRHVRVVLFDEASHFDELGTSAGLEGVARVPSTPGFSADLTWRGVHGVLMERLAPAGASAVIWDSTFKPETPFDDVFLRGLDALRHREPPTDVVSTRRTWHPATEEGVPFLNEKFQDRVLSGATLIDAGQQTDDNTRRPVVWRFELALKHTQTGFLLSAPLLAHGLTLNPGTVPVADATDSGHRLMLRFIRRNPAAPGVEIPVGTGREVPVSLVEKSLSDSEEDGVLEGDLISTFLLHMPGDGVLRDATDRYEDVFRMPDDQRSAKFAGKIAVIGQVHDNDIQPYADGRLIPGTYALAAATEFLRRGVCIRLVAGFPRVLYAASFAVAGVLLAVVAGGSFRRFLFLLAVLLLTAVLGSWLLYLRWAVLFNPLLPIIDLTVSAVVARAVLNLSRRHGQRFPPMGSRA